MTTIGKHLSASGGPDEAAVIVLIFLPSCGVYVPSRVQILAPHTVCFPEGTAAPRRESALTNDASLLLNSM